MKSILKNSNLIVIKIGSVLVRGNELDQVNQHWMNALAQDISALRTQGKKIVIVSSGGVALGRKALGISANVSPSSIPLAKKQAASSVGQFHLFNGYFNAFKKQDIITAQVLLTISETENRRMNLNARATLHTLIDNGIIPIINENDTVSTEEIRFGDNDRLSVRVAQMILADTVLILSTTDGLYTDNPDTNPQAKHISLIENITDEHKKMAGEAISGLSTGGMKSKIEAACAATRSGINLIITNGQGNHSLASLYNDSDKTLTLFVAQECDNNARQIWLSAHMNPKGCVVIDDGALSALKNGKSLLPIGIKEVHGDFRRGDVIEIKSLSDVRVGMGVCAYNADDARRIIGKNSAKINEILGYIDRSELVHRNDMVLDS
ncbi:MAG: glutamate 5-kinase [Zetaproteobacteria bacterium]|nr:MAG: glutamate 5-kinase [Zetaproteobacteria bacterium]